MTHLWPWLAALSSGLLLTFCFPYWDQGWLVWIALGPLVAALLLDSRPALEDGKQCGRLKRFARHPIGRAFLLGYTTGLIFFWCTFYWLTTVTGPGWFLLGFYMGLYQGAWAAYLAAIRPSAGDFTRSGANLRLAFAGAAAWVALEWVRGWLFSGFGWNGLGIAFYQNLTFIQLAEYTGVCGLSFLAAFTNLIAVITLYRFLSEIQQRRIRPHWDFSVTMALIAATFLYGVRTLFAPQAGEAIPLKVAAVQPNIPQVEKFDLAFEKQIFDRLTFLTGTALEWKPDLVVWPEASTPRGLFADETNFRFVQEIAQSGSFNFLLGSLDVDFEAREEYNIAALIAPGAESISTYRKMHLVPFGEYIPFRKSFPLFAWIIGDLVPTDFSPGREYSILTLQNPKVDAAALICFEDTLGELTRRFVRDGNAQLLVNVTNDGWFLRSAGSRQHLANALFRAVENRRPLVRAANTGVTAFIDPLGRILHTFEDPFAEGVLTGTVPVPPPEVKKTFYTRYGELFSKGAALSAIILLPLLRRRRS